MECETDRRFVEVSVVMQGLYLTVVVKKDLLLCLRCDPHLGKNDACVNAWMSCKLSVITHITQTCWISY